MVKIKTTGKYNITYNNIDYSFESGNDYIVDKDVATMLVESNYAKYAEEIENGVIKSKKTDNNK